MDAYPGLRRLLDLRTRGWVFRSVLAEGELELIAGARTWPDGWSDAIAVRDVDDARAFRCDPDGGEIWKYEGDLVEVIDAVTELPAPDQPGAPRLVKAKADRLWVPGDPLR
jgi:hypothetical protein